ncbi:DNA polymerase III subunit chi [Azoarcus sp. L1K30]|uniref:DNA polymerase III subunit chi n=1 Tax=Azoarcus sp. L1K30 TaxID=2820277 RepID=UPI001B82FE9A|nr:DNA polymerase III subunit chi [Azoarcus sp. L1K30]
MTRVQFYHNTPDRLALTCELAAKAHEGGRKVAIRVADGAHARRLDQHLWTAEPLSFIPHVLIDSPLAAETPIVIGLADSHVSWPHADLLFNLADDVPPHFDRFRTVIEIVGRNEADKLPARARWQHYKAHGAPLKAFDAESRSAL